MTASNRVEVAQVVRRDHAELPHELDRELQVGGDGLAVAVEELGQDVAAVDDRRRHPGEVVEPDVPDLDALGVDAHPLGDRALEGDRHVAQPDGSISAINERLGHDPDRVGEVDDPGIRRAAAGRDVGQVEDDRYGAQRLGQAAGTGRLLADGAEADRDRLVQQPRRLPADAELDQHEAGAVDGSLDVGGERQSALEPEAGEHAAGHAADHGAALVIDVVEHELIDGQPLMALRQTLDQLRGIGAPAADDCDLDPHRKPRRVLTRLLITL